MCGTIRILFLLGLALSCVACGGGGGGAAATVATVPPPPPPPPTKPPIACAGADTFPGFLYSVAATPTTPNELRLASSDACRTESLGISNSRAATIHMTADRSSGVVVWTEEVDNNGSEIVWRLDFTVDVSVNPDGELVLGTPVQILPMDAEQPLPGDHLHHHSVDIWGDATHDSLYLTIFRKYVINSGPDTGGGPEVTMIYDLNDLTGDLFASPDVRVLYEQTFTAGGGLGSRTWLDAGDAADLPDCLSVPYPQFVPTCYRVSQIRFNPSGTRLYFERNLSDYFTSERWESVQRIHIDTSSGPALADWTLTGPELVYSGRDSGGLIAPTGMLPRPDDDVSVLPSPEYVAVVHRDGGAITEIAAILNADQCASDFAPYADGNLDGSPDLWQGCMDNNTFFTGSLPGRGTSWQSPEALLKRSFQDPTNDIHRVYVSGGLSGTEQLMIETADFADSGN